MLAENNCSQQAAAELAGDSHEAPCSINELPPAILVNSDRFSSMQSSVISFCQPDEEYLQRI